MAELRKRKDMDPAYTWDLSTLYQDDQAWEKDLTSLDEEADRTAAFQGRLKDAASIRAYLDAVTALDRRVSNLYVYASCRHDEDTAENDAKTLLAKISAKYAEVMAKISFAEPEILSLR